MSGVSQEKVGSELVKLARLAIPLSLAHLAQTGMSFVDTAMVGRLGPQELAALALGATTFATVNIVLMAVLLAVSPLVAQAVGGRRVGEPGRVTSQALYLAFGLSLVGVTLFYVAEPLLLAAGLPPATVSLAASYLKAVAFGFPFTLGFVALRGLLEGHGDAAPILYLAIAGVGVNVFLNDALMFGRYGLPELGMVGTGYATAVVYFLLFLGGVLLVRWRYRGEAVFSGLARFDTKTTLEIVRLGLPIAVMLGLESGTFSLTSFLMGRFGDVVLAGHQIAIQSASMTFMIPLGVGAAAAVRVGHAAGRGSDRGVKLAGYLGVGIAAVFMILTALLYRFAPRLVIGLYVDLADPQNLDVIAYATTFLAIAALFQVVDGVQVTTQGALRGIKDTRVPMLITIVAYWLLGVTPGLLMTYVLGVGPRGLWFGLALGLGAAAVMLILRFAHLTRSGPGGRARGVLKARAAPEL